MGFFVFIDQEKKIKIFSPEDVPRTALQFCSGK